MTLRLADTIHPSFRPAGHGCATAFTSLVAAGTALALLVAALLAARPASAAVAYSQDFEGSHGWTLNVASGTNAAEANLWVVSDAEGGVTPPGCQGTPNGNRTLHVTRSQISNSGASYNAGGLCGFLDLECVTTDRRAESPAFSTLGLDTVTLSFDFVSVGQDVSDNATIWFDNGGGWTPVAASVKSSESCGLQAVKWSTLSVDLPKAATNQANLRVAIRWENNDDGIGSDPSVAIDNVVVQGSAAVPTATNTPTNTPPAIATPTPTMPPTHTATATATATAQVVQGDCTSAPRSGCAVAERGALTMMSNIQRGRGEIDWRFDRGPILAPGAFGDPTTSSSYAVCIYDDGALIAADGVPSGSRWRPIGDERGYVYTDRSSAAGAVSSVRLDGRQAKNSTIVVGASLIVIPAAPDRMVEAATGVTVQLQRLDGGCFESTFGPATLRKNTSNRVRAVF